MLGIFCSVLALRWRVAESSVTWQEIFAWIIPQPHSDTDTNACIAGAVIGALQGWEEMRKDSLTASNLEVVETHYLRDTDFPVPPEFQVRDIDLMAEGLAKLSI